MKIELKNFIEEYKQLCIKYNMVIDSCGCCNSPWVIIFESAKFNDYIIEHIKNIEKYSPYPEP
jgi:hypothetical protein